MPILFVKCRAGEHVRHAELRGFRGNSLVVAARMSDLLVESCMDTPNYHRHDATAAGSFAWLGHMPDGDRRRCLAACHGVNR